MAQTSRSSLERIAEHRQQPRQARQALEAQKPRNVAAEAQGEAAAQPEEPLSEEAKLQLEADEKKRGNGAKKKGCPRPLHALLPVTSKFGTKFPMCKSLSLHTCVD